MVGIRVTKGVKWDRVTIALLCRVPLLVLVVLGLPYENIH